MFDAKNNGDMGMAHLWLKWGGEGGGQLRVDGWDSEPHTRCITVSKPHTRNVTVSEPYSSNSSVSEPHSTTVDTG